jgi:Spy/CpxP family protein refolding chaperone
MYAQGMGQKSKQGGGMMGGGMMGGGMMSKGMMSGGGCSMMGGGGMDGFYLNKAEALGLSDAQVAKLKNIKMTTKKALIQKEADLRIAKLELDELLQNPKAKRSDIEAKAKKVQDLKSDIALTKLRARLDARSVLTPEQLEKAKSLKHGKGMMGKSGGSNGSSEHAKHHPGN